MNQIPNDADFVTSAPTSPSTSRKLSRGFIGTSCRTFWSTAIPHANPGGINAIIRGVRRIEFKMQTLKLTIYETENYQFACICTCHIGSVELGAAGCNSSCGKLMTSYRCARITAQKAFYELNSRKFTAVLYPNLENN